MSQRGPTWTEAHRHACEVRHVLALPSRGHRAAYLEAVAAKRGQPAADRLRADVQSAWAAARSAAPPPPGDSPAPASPGSVHLGVNAPRTVSVPAHGSFLAPPAAGSSDPIKGVESGAAA